MGLGLGDTTGGIRRRRRRQKRECRKWLLLAPFVGYHYNDSDPKTVNQDQPRGSPACESTLLCLADIAVLWRRSRNQRRRMSRD